MRIGFRVQGPELASSTSAAMTRCAHSCSAQLVALDLCIRSMAVVSLQRFPTALQHLHLHEQTRRRPVSAAISQLPDPPSKC